MRYRRQLHPWFDIPEVHRLRELSLAQGSDYIALEQGEIKSWRDAHIEPVNGQALPWLFGPTIIPQEEAQAEKVRSAMNEVLLAKGISKDFQTSVDHFTLKVGRDNISLSFRVEKDKFWIGSETRKPDESPIPWITGTGIHLEAVPAITATQEAEIGGYRDYLLDVLEDRPIRKTLHSFLLSEERDFSNQINSIDFDDFSFNLEHTR